jgi:hypothetical protein
VRSFVLGCAACKGSLDGHCGNLVFFGQSGAFGYPSRQWAEFGGGDILLAAVGTKEVRFRLQQSQPTALQGGTDAECAERLLLLQRNITRPESLLVSLGSNSLPVLRRRLGAVGLRRRGSKLECAERLLLVLSSLVESLVAESFDREGDDEMPPLEGIDGLLDPDDLRVSTSNALNGFPHMPRRIVLACSGFAVLAAIACSAGVFVIGSVEYVP